MHLSGMMVHERESHTESAAEESTAYFCRTGTLVIDKILWMPHHIFVGLLNILSNLITAQNYTENCVDSICVAAYEYGLH